MKTKFALLDENDRVIKTSDSVSDIANYHELLKNRRTGKSTRAIFRALSNEYTTYIVYKTNSFAKTHFENLKWFLDNLEFEYTTIDNRLELKPKLSGVIRFITEETCNKLTPLQYNTLVIIRDID